MNALPSINPDCPKCKQGHGHALPLGTKGTLYPSFNPSHRCGKCGWEWVAKDRRQIVRDMMEAIRDNASDYVINHSPSRKGAL